MRLSLLLAAVSLVATTSLQAVPLLTISPSSQTVTAGSSTDVQVLVSGLASGSAPSLGAYDLNFTFDPTIVAFTSLTFGDSMQGDQLDLSGTGSISDSAIQSPGLLEFFEISLDQASVLDSQQAGSFVLATLHLQGLASGTTSLALSVNSLSDSSGAPLTATADPGSITVTATPEPGALWLFPLAGAWIAARFRRSQQPRG